MDNHRYLSILLGYSFQNHPCAADHYPLLLVPRTSIGEYYMAQVQPFYDQVDPPSLNFSVFSLLPIHSPRIRHSVIMAVEL